MSLALSTERAPSRGPVRVNYLGASPEVVLRRLRVHVALTQGDVDLVTTVAARAQRTPSQSELHAQGDGPMPARMILAGWAARVRRLPDGRRQILGVVLPGDVVGVPALDALSQCALVALTSIDSADAASLAGAPAEGGLCRALKALTQKELCRITDHVVRLGRQTAYERTAAWLLETNARMEEVGLSDGVSCPMPVTQEMLADLLGLSIVHVNRTLQQLRVAGLIQLKGGRLTLLDPPALAAARGGL